MKIKSIRATPILVPLEAPYLWSYGALDGFTKCVVEVETTDGLVGIGEAPSHSSARIIESFSDRIIGLDPLDIAGLERRVLPSMPAAHSVTDYGLRGAWGGVDIALWDLRGKLWGQPVANLLGGIHCNAIPFTDYFSYRLAQDGKGGETSIEAVVDYCLALHQTHGTTFFEGKVSDPDLNRNIALMQALRRALGPQAMLRIDSNQAFSLPSCLHLAPAFEELGIRNWEDPTPDWTTMKRLRTRTTIPFSGHNTDLGKAVAYGTPDAIVSDVAGLGGFSAMLRFVSACAGAGIDFWCYSGGSGLETAAYLHACAAHPHIREPNQSLLRQQPFDVIAEGPFAAKNNLIALPAGPGLGVTLDPDRLRFAANLLVERGIPNKYHDPDAPGKMRRMPLI
ncbi:mandelate racemase/muconate lactonizing enzyme family protein [Tabrizicola sp.]|uniref:mandelate racemase/muconate lactonizing enzyme family protein n=1 Tax=Tabrizicola sp. TaxID=2005166 RepID=UPI00286B4892|nr:mandelate racemase/muconate lactonizing enzyme family protein [Tabrizicola sp.]